MKQEPWADSNILTLMSVEGAYINLHYHTVWLLVLLLGLSIESKLELEIFWEGERIMDLNLSKVYLLLIFPHWKITSLRFHLLLAL